MKTVAIIVAGYLGAGKTTLINKALKAGQGLRSLVLVNDFGDINIDASLIAQSTDDIISLVNGCACCQIGDDLTQTLEAMIDKLGQFDRVIFEASGVADLGNLRSHFEGLAEHFHLQELMVVDGSRINALLKDKFVGQHVRAQIGCARNILLSKIEHLDLDGLSRLTNTLDTLNKEMVFVEGLHTLTEAGVGHVGKSEQHPSFYSRAIEGEGLLNTKILEEWLERLPASVHRVKGYIETEAGWMLVQYVPWNKELISVDISSVAQRYINRLSIISVVGNISEEQLASPWL